MIWNDCIFVVEGLPGCQFKDGPAVREATLALACINIFVAGTCLVNGVGWPQWDRQPTSGKSALPHLWVNVHPVLNVQM